jgi:hypothetical protein
MGEKTRSVLVGERKGKRSLGTLCCRWEDNIKLVFKKLDGYSSGPGYRQILGSCKYADELVFHKMRESS